MGIKYRMTSSPLEPTLREYTGSPQSCWLDMGSLAGTCTLACMTARKDGT